jgi:hypothetical protein
MNSVKVASRLFLSLSIPALLLSADLIPVKDGSRPLNALALELQKRYAYLVSYEEAPYDDESMAASTRPNGIRFRQPGFAPMVFHIPDLPEERSLGAFPKPAGGNTILPSLLLSLVKEYNDSGNPGQFTALFEGGYAHIVPAARTVDKKAQSFEPILSTMMSYTSKEQSCGEALNDLLNRVGSQRGVALGLGIVPVGPLMTRQCSVVANDLPARDVLLQILNQLEIGYSLDQKALYSWSLLYDANTDKYYLNTTIVRNLYGQNSGLKAPSQQGTPPNQATRSKLLPEAIER